MIFRRKKEDEIKKEVISIPGLLQEKEEVIKNNTIGFSIAKCSVVGDRKYQQDKARFKVWEDKAIAVLCDGMGGMVDGEAASRVATKYFIKDFSNYEFNENITERLVPEMNRLDEKVIAIKKESGELGASGTTLVGVLLKEDKMWFVSVGDSRIYLLRNDKLETLTQDHNFELVLKDYKKKGYMNEQEYQDALKDKKSQALISFLGLGKRKIVDKSEQAIRMYPGDKLILCSDGLYKALYEDQIKSIASEEYTQTEEIAKRLVRVASDCSVGDQDNTTVIVIEYCNK